MGKKITLSLAGIPSGKDQIGGFSSLLLLTGLSIAAGTLIYSATTRSINANSMLQTSRYQNSRDAIANSIRYTVSIPALLLQSAKNDHSSPLFSCIDSTQINHCESADASAVPHDLKLYDTRGFQLTGTTANPVYYDAQSGGLCNAFSTDPCQLQATASFTIKCGGAPSCQGVSSAILYINFKVELKPGASLPNNTTLKPFDLNPSLQIPLSAVKAGAVVPSTAPPDQNDKYTPISDPTTESDITIFDPVNGSKTCNDMKALGNPKIIYDPPTPTSNPPGTTYSSITGDLNVADEIINNISLITGNLWVTAKTLTQASDITAGSQGVNINAVDIGDLTNITSSHTSIASHTLNSVSNLTGHLYANADTIGTLSNVTTSGTRYLLLVNRGWVASGTTSSTPVSLSNITSGRFLMCGFSINDLSNITADFIGIANGSVVANSSNVTVNQLTVYGGTLGNLSNFTGNLTVYNTTVGTITTSTGNIQAYGGSISQVNGTGNVDLYNGATLGSHSASVTVTTH